MTDGLIAIVTAVIAFIIVLLFAAMWVFGIGLFQKETADWSSGNRFQAIGAYCYWTGEVMPEFDDGPHIPVADRVHAGAEYLDKYEPGWADRIDLSTLNLATFSDCVFGQLYEFYHIGADLARARGYEPVQLGVIIHILDKRPDYIDQDALWKEEIMARRGVEVG